MAAPSFFALFGVNPILGRGLEESDARAGNDHVVVLGMGCGSAPLAAIAGLLAGTCS